MVIRQVVRVEILGAWRPYTYAWEFDPEEGGQPLKVGDRVELPPNQVQDEGSGMVVGLGSDYDGPMKNIVRVIRTRGSDQEIDEFDMWEGWEA